MNKKTLTAVALGTAAVAAPLLLRRKGGGDSGAVATSLRIERPADEVWRAWRRLEDLPRHLRHVERVESLDGDGSVENAGSVDNAGRRTRWTGVAPGGHRVEWEAEIVDETPGRRLAWASLPGSEVRHRGEVEVEPLGDDASILRVAIDVEGGGLVGQAAARLEPLTRRTLREDLRRFKSLVEAGEVPRVDGQPTGERSAIDPTNPF
jgi:uncharacterized membrane protein